MNESDKVSKQIQNKDARAESEASDTAHGVRYAPDAVNGAYRSEKYMTDGSQIILNRNEISAEKDKRRTSRGAARGSLAKTLLIVAVVSCIFISFISGFGSALFVGSHSSSQHGTPDIPKEPGASGGRVDNTTYIDYSDNSHTVETVSPGTMMSMEEAIQAVKDSVVEITTETVKSGFGGYSQYVVSGAGSGVVISTGGYIITNNHVIDGATNIIVRLTDGTEYEAKLIGTDAKTDIAVIAIEPSSDKALTTAIIGTSSTLRLGQTVIAIGNPLGELGGTVTDGIISSLERQVAMDGSGYMTLLQTNAAVNPGNSGGGLFDLYGRLIGVVNAKSSGQGIEGISFAIPIDTAWDVASQLIDKGYVSGRPSLGLTLKQVQYGASFFGDIYTQVIVDQDHAEYGLKANDIIISVNGYEIVDLNDVAESISANSVGDSVVVRIKRDRKYYELKIKLVEYVPSEGTQQ